jgi:hypothetical protein
MPINSQSRYAHAGRLTETNKGTRLLQASCWHEDARPISQPHLLVDCVDEIMPVVGLHDVINILAVSRVL